MASNSVTLALGRRGGDGFGLSDGNRVGDEVGYNKYGIRENTGQQQKRIYANSLPCVVATTY